MVVGGLNRWQTHAFVSPCWILATLGLLQFSVAGTALMLLCAYCAVAILLSLLGRYWALCVAVAIWVCLGIAVANILLPLTGMFAGGAVAIVLVFWSILHALRIGAVWGQTRVAAMQAKGRPMREWEWVYTGRDFALSHRLSAGLGPVWSVLGFVIIQWGVVG